MNCAGVATDAAGNAYVVGTFAGTLAPTALATPISASGFDDAFIAKFSPNLDLAWAERFGSSNAGSGDTVGVDPFGERLHGG